MTAEIGQSIDGRESSFVVKPEVFQFNRDKLFLRKPQLLFWGATAIAIFQLAYCFSQLGVLALAYPICLIQLARAGTSRQSFYLGLAVGLFNAAFQLTCFWTIFGISAVALWCILAF